MRAISADPEIDEERRLETCPVCAFTSFAYRTYLQAYRTLDEDNLKLLTFGPHENFYRDLKPLDE
ncbi:type II toxin-antitoxin system RelE/ParE family toxin [Methylobacter sp.]|uniref:type II toxin-antitoxin system RelE/ParE family toxin n=1 Tax=Methylobacter sp. TaxID=2051955 RepID=UPI00248A815D|nr:type II toxin-antitoxin system RelE/ParE family toxin [Methylobacter sp.]MDI1277746.1 type II toxin-antitoxin system RelE/ParE family toxin [Methylobacter sp.]MDI1358352.1 type II toxin-antitoxin system RelE/ParE family toxin [Methylobacter sp.]